MAALPHALKKDVLNVVKLKWTRRLVATQDISGFEVRHHIQIMARSERMTTQKREVLWRLVLRMYASPPVVPVSRRECRDVKPPARELVVERSIHLVDRIPGKPRKRWFESIIDFSRHVIMSPSSSGQGHHPLTVKTRVRLP